MRLYIVRHGQTEWNQLRQVQGHTNIPLNETGRQQAALLSEALRELPVRHVISSDLLRCTETAQAVLDATGAQLETTSLLRERCFGDWEGLSFEKFTAGIAQLCHITGHSIFDARPTGGESIRDAWDRVNPIAEKLRDFHTDTVVVTHGNIGALLLAHMLHGTIETSRSFSLHNAAITELFLRQNGFFQVVRLNDATHLDTLNETPVG